MRNKITRTVHLKKKPLPPSYPENPLEEMKSWIFLLEHTNDFYIMFQVDTHKYVLGCLNNGNRLNNPSESKSVVFGEGRWRTIDYSITIEPKK